jgi:hypothetical protein
MSLRRPDLVSVVHIKAHAVGTLTKMRRRDVSPVQRLRQASPRLLLFSDKNTGLQGYPEF